MHCLVCHIHERHYLSFTFTQKNSQTTELLIHCSCNVCHIGDGGVNHWFHDTIQQYRYDIVSIQGSAIDVGQCQYAHLTYHCYSHNVVIWFILTFNKTDMVLLSIVCGDK